MGTEPVAVARSESAEQEIGPPTEPLPGSLRELALAIFGKCDPVEAGRRLLEEGSDSVKARVFENLAAWAYEAPRAGNRPGEARQVPQRYIWDIPGPPHEPPCE